MPKVLSHTRFDNLIIFYPGLLFRVSQKNSKTLYLKKCSAVGLACWCSPERDFTALCDIKRGLMFRLV